MAETEEKAIANAREFMWMQGEFTGLSHPVWSAPSGYLGQWSRRAMAKQRAAGYRRSAPSFEQQRTSGQIITGTPDQLVRKLRVILEMARPSILGLWANDGRVSHEDSMTCIRLLGQEVMPALREIGKELGLASPFELNTPVSLDATPKEDLRSIPA